MDPLLLGTASAFGLAAATGLNASLPLLLVGLAARFGLITLVSPYDALGSTTALIGLAVIAVVEITADKIPGVDSIVHVLQGPVTLAAGAIIVASQQSMVQDVSPGLAILLGLFSAGGIHALRALARPVYRWVAQNRHRLPGGTAACQVNPTPKRAGDGARAAG